MAMASLSKMLTTTLLLTILSLAADNGTTAAATAGVEAAATAGVEAAATWCVARSDASQAALQTALDYACGEGAECAPVRPSGPCHLPNTVQSHASYAFNSYYQRKGSAPDSCDFGGTATASKTDPSYGSCVYPSSPRYATPSSSSSPIGSGLSAAKVSTAEMQSKSSPNGRGRVELSRQFGSVFAPYISPMEWPAAGLVVASGGCAVMLVISVWMAGGGGGQLLVEVLRLLFYSGLGFFFALIVLVGHFRPTDV
ncbi:1,3-beta-glucanosyltransferase GAS1-like [Rhododendron vialii]|uniref:1,3-beta-glucanosyltransferase GAS1-like n=1 Tax=Rhododendron vialii TaxID=182163 RepID=UPI00265F890F|nr:1,3-beta-glucanosyltransferase GAS1-like [Rhododendron vialii]